MKRSQRSAVLLVAGAAGLFVTLGVLVRAVHSEAPELHPTVSSSPTATSTGAPGAPAAPSLSGNGPIASRDPARSKSIWKAPVFRPTDDSGGAAASAPVVDENAPPATRGNTKNLQFGGEQLRNQTKAVAAKMQHCVDEAKQKGIAPTGTAMLTYVVAKHGDKYEVEDTGIDEDKTTLPSGDLLDCMRTTAFAMHFEGLPREATGIVASRSVTLKDGVITEYKHVGFSYLR